VISEIKSPDINSETFQEAPDPIAVECPMEQDTVPIADASLQQRAGGDTTAGALEPESTGPSYTEDANMAWAVGPTART